MLDPKSVDLEMLAHALSDQSWDGQWLFDPRTGETGYWSSDLDSPDEEDTEHLLPVEPLPSWVWYQDMVDFTERVSDEAAGRRLARALRGKGAFRRFRNELHEEYPDLVPVWNAFNANRAALRAVEWLFENDLVDERTWQQFTADHPDPEIP